MKKLTVQQIEPPGATRYRRLNYATQYRTQNVTPKQCRLHEKAWSLDNIA